MSEAETTTESPTFTGRTYVTTEDGTKIAVDDLPTIVELLSRVSDLEHEVRVLKAGPAEFGEAKEGEG